MQPQEQLMQLWSCALWHLLCFNQVWIDMHSSQRPAPVIGCVLQQQVDIIAFEQCANQHNTDADTAVTTTAVTTYAHQLLMGMCLTEFSSYPSTSAATPPPPPPPPPTTLWTLKPCPVAQGRMVHSLLHQPGKLLWLRSALWVKPWGHPAPSPSLRCCLPWWQQPRTCTAACAAAPWRLQQPAWLPWAHRPCLSCPSWCPLSLQQRRLLSMALLLHLHRTLR